MIMHGTLLVHELAFLDLRQHQKRLRIKRNWLELKKDLKAER
jgi:hypothetical protein